MTNFRCSNCSAQEAQIFLAACPDYYMRKPGRFDYYRCLRCGLIQLYPVPKDISLYYESYQVHAKKSLLHQLVRKRIMGKGYYFPKAPPEGKALLDFGCGDGWYLEEMTKRGWKTFGFEFNRGYARALSERIGLSVLSDLEDLEKSYAGFFDVLTMHFVLEHLDRPAERFHAVSRLLKRGGLFYFLIPNISGLEFRVFGKKWHGMDHPRHLSFLDESLVRALAREHGFSILERRYVGLPNGFAGSMSAVVLGRFSYMFFVSMIPLGIAFSSLFPDANVSYLLRKT